MNELEATRAKLKCLEMVEGTSLKWWEVVRFQDSFQHVKALSVFENGFSFPSAFYAFAIGVVEGKPVWEGDELYYNGADKILASISVKIDRGHNLRLPGWSWNPPKPAAKALSAFEQADLQKERDELYDELVKLYGVVEGLDWSLPGDMVVLNRTRAASACDSASKVISKYYRGML